MRITKFILLFTVVSILPALSSPSLASGKKHFLTGSNKALWLITNNDDGYEVLTKPATKKWGKLTQKQAPGKVIAASGFGKQLYLILDGNINIRIGSNAKPAAGTNCNDTRWPRDASQIALCAGKNLAGKSTAETTTAIPGQANKFILIAVVPRAANKSAGEELDDKKALRQPRNVILGIFAFTGKNWQYLADAGEVTLASDDRIEAVTLDDKLFILVSSDKTSEGSRLFSWSLDQTSSVEMPAPAATNLTMLTANSKLLFTGLTHKGDTSKENQLALMFRNPETNLYRTAAIIRSGEGYPFPTSAEIEILVTKFADSIAFTWQEDDSWKFGTCGINGNFLPLTPPNNLDPADMTGPERAMEYILWAVVIILFALMVIARPRKPITPFTLPSYIKRSPILKRILAGIIDFLPCVIIASVIFSPDTSKITDFRSLLELSKMPSPTTAYAVMLSLILYIIMGAFLEWKYGATLGKKLMKLKVVGDLGLKATARECILRNLVKFIEFTFPPSLPPILLALPLINRYRLRLGDIFARTAVVQYSQTLEVEEELEKTRS